MDLHYLYFVFQLRLYSGWYNLVTLLRRDSVNNSRQSCYKSHTQETDQITCNNPFHSVKTEDLCLKQNNRVWSGFVIIAAHFLTLSFKAARPILSICNGRVDVSAVCCTAIASSVGLLMHSPSLNAGRGGKGATADSVRTCLAMPAV